MIKVYAKKPDSIYYKEFLKTHSLNPDSLSNVEKAPYVEKICMLDTDSLAMFVFSIGGMDDIGLALRSFVPKTTPIDYSTWCEYHKLCVTPEDGDAFNAVETLFKSIAALHHASKTPLAADRYF